MLLKIFITGCCILIVALLFNSLESYLKIDTWYSFIQNIQKNGISKAISQTSPISKTFLFIIYPFVLGLTGYIALRLLKLF